MRSRCMREKFTIAQGQRNKVNEVSGCLVIEEERGRKRR